MSSAWDSQQAAIEAALEADPNQAFSRLRPALGHPAVLPPWEPAFQLFAKVSNRLGDRDMAKLAARVAGSANNMPVLREFADALYERRLYDVALNVLIYLDSQQPGIPPILWDVCANCDELMRHDVSVGLLEKWGGTTSEHFPLSYALAEGRMLLGRTADARAAINRARYLAENEDDRALLVSVEGMVARAENLGLDGAASGDLRAWHLALTGGLLLHQAGASAGEGTNGRYALVADTYSRCRRAIDALAEVLPLLGLKVPRVYHLADRDSEIIAAALAERLSLPLEAWPAEGSRRAGFIVAYDLGLNRSDEEFEGLQQRRAGQYLWSHANSWTEPFPIAPDFATFLHQINVRPWAEALEVAGSGEVAEFIAEAQARSEGPREDAPVAEIAQAILAATPDSEDPILGVDLAEVLAPTRTLPPVYRPGALGAEGFRPRMHKGGPIESKRF